MTEIIKDMFDLTYWLTVVPVGMAYLGYYWHKDQKVIDAMEVNSDVQG